MLDKMKKTLFPILLVALIFALTLGTVVLAAADFTIGGADGSSYGLILEKKIGSDNQEETAQNKNFSFWLSGESIQQGSRQKWVNGIVTLTGPSRETIYIDGCDSHVIVAEIRNDLTIKQVKNAAAMAEPELKTVVLYDDILEIHGPKLVKDGDQWVEETADIFVRVSGVPAVQEVAELQGKYMVIKGTSFTYQVDGEGNEITDDNGKPIIVDGDPVELAVWTADIDGTDLTIDRSGIVPADLNRFYFTPTGDAVTFRSDKIGNGEDREYTFHIKGQGDHGPNPVDLTITLKAGEISAPIKKLPHDTYLITEEPCFTVGAGQGVIDPRPMKVHAGPFSEITITKSITEVNPDSPPITTNLAIQAVKEDQSVDDMKINAIFQTVYAATPENPLVLPQEVTVDGLTPGQLYRIVDEENIGFTVSYMNQLPMEVTARTEGNGMPTTTFTNTYDKAFGSLLVSKTVKGAKEDAPEEFTFTLTMSDPDGVPFDGEYIYTGGRVIDDAEPAADGVIRFKNGSGTITLKHGQSILIDGLLPGTHYAIGETVEKIDGENAFKTVKINGKKVSAVDDMVSSGEKLIAAGENKVAFSNENGSPDGPIGSNDDLTDLVIRKTVVVEDDDDIIIDDFFFDDDDDIIIEDDFWGDDDIIIEDEEDEFTFVLTVKDADGRPLKDYQLYVGGSSIDGVEPAEGGYLFCGSGTFTLKHGQYITVKGLPVGGTYEVTEVVTEDYPTAEINGEWVDETNGVFSSGIVKIEPDNNETVFTNYKTVEIEDPEVPKDPFPKDSLTITKTVKGAKEGSTKEFAFTLILKDAYGRDLVGFFDFEGGSIAEGVAPAADDFAFIVGEYTFTLKDGQSLTMKDVPISTVYEVKETAVADFPVVKVDGVTVAAVDGVVSSGEGEVGQGGNVVAFTNQTESTPDEPKDDTPKGEDPKDSPKDDPKGDDPGKDKPGTGDNTDDKSGNGNDSYQEKDDKQESHKDTDIPNTGDDSRFVLASVLCAASLAAVLLLLVWRKKYSHHSAL